MPPQSVQVKKKTVVHRQSTGGKNKDSQSLVEDEQYEVVLDGNNIVVSPISKEARKPEDGILVTNFQKYVSLMNSSTGFQDRTLVSDLLHEISVHCSSRGKPDFTAAATVLPDCSGVPLIFNKWARNTTDCIEYNCLPTSKELNVFLKIPSSLTKLLDDAVKRVVNPKSSSTTHEVTVRIGISATSDPSVAELAASLQALDINAEAGYFITDVNALLALIVVLKCYPKKWWEEFFWDAWLAVTIQMYILGNPESLQNDHLKHWQKIDDVTKAELFPCLWMTTKGVFYAESLVDDPNNVQYLLMGQDPVSMKAPLSKIRKATGIAFHNIGDDNPSIRGMSIYELDCEGNKPEEYCKKRPHGLLLVNMVRCIFNGGKSMDGNICHLAWTAYTLKLAHYFGTCKNKYVMVFSKSEDFKPCLTDEYLPKVIPTKKLLHVPHPTRVAKYCEKYQNDAVKMMPIKKVCKKLKNFTAEK